MNRKPSSSPRSKKQTAGSPVEGEPVFVAVGFLRRPHGIHGEMLMDVLTDFPERMKPHRQLFLGDSHEPVRIEKVRWADQSMLIKFEGMDDAEALGRFRNTVVYVLVDQLPPLPEGQYYHHQLLGLRVVSDEGQFLGVLEQILETGANDVYLVHTPEDKEILLPAIEEVILSVNLEDGEMVVHLQEWA
ncbi:ribosome maturation factor RimM [Anaerolinea sp.]|uniref:ribosome maturation factor RimM n=1 Tax=Anaerolinea sp. TaxID=1872519 RepID=UPI002ACDF770|nr:ribosome maturation factor RimM [Anaerolinea sp.]